MNYISNLNPVIQTLIATLFTFLITALGSSLVFVFRKPNKTLMDAMLGFAAGVMIAASFFSLLNPALEMSVNLNFIPWIIVTSGFLVGGIFLFLGDKLYDVLVKKSEKSKRTFMLILSITLHNIPEGLAVGVAFGAILYNLEGANFLTASLLALGIGIQNFPEGTAISLPLKRDGFSAI